jgi:hypothetical protein
MRETSEANQANWEGLAARWRKHFVTKLQNLYGLPKEEAGTKADAWLGWLKRGTDPEPQILRAPEIVAEVHRRLGSRRMNARMRVGKSRSKSVSKSLK